MGSSGEQVPADCIYPAEKDGENTLALPVPCVFSYSHLNVVQSLVSFLEALLHALVVTAGAVPCGA